MVHQIDEFFHLRPTVLDEIEFGRVVRPMQHLYSMFFLQEVLLHCVVSFVKVMHKDTCGCGLKETLL